MDRPGFALKIGVGLRDRWSEASHGLIVMKDGSHPFYVPGASTRWKRLSRTDFNAHTITEFRRNHGKVGGNFEGAPLLLLHTAGRRSGKPRINPMMYLKDGERYLVFASKGGSDTNPDWYYNLKAHPDVQVEIGDEIIDVRAEEITGREHDALYERQAIVYPAFASYQRRTKRIIPVIALTKKKR